MSRASIQRRCVPRADRHLQISLLYAGTTLLLVAALTVGCGVFRRGQATPTARPTVLVTPRPTAARIPDIQEPMPSVEDTGAEIATVEPSVELTETYRNEDAGYGFRYPRDWLVDGEGEYVSVQNYRNEDLPPRVVNDPDLIKIEFVWIRPGQAQSVDAMLEQMESNVVGTPREINLNGLSGRSLEVSGGSGDVSRVLLLHLSGRVLLVQTWQPGPLFERITATLGPLD